MPESGSHSFRHRTRVTNPATSGLSIGNTLSHARTAASYNTSAGRSFSGRGQGVSARTRSSQYVRRRATAWHCVGWKNTSSTCLRSDSGSHSRSTAEACRTRASVAPASTSIQRNSSEFVTADCGARRTPLPPTMIARSEPLSRRFASRSGKATSNVRDRASSRS